MISLLNLINYLISLRQAIRDIPQLDPSKNETDYLLNYEFPKVSVIVPAYNEADNIKNCILSILNSTDLSVDKLEVWVVDDRSTDNTLTILNLLEQSLNDSRLKILPGLDRPAEEIWTGKNWACAQAALRAKGEFLLFIDADVMLKPKAIETVVQVARSSQIDLLNCVSALVCKSLAEWLVQPLMFINLLVSLNSKALKDPKKNAAFAIGSFMLFRRSAYDRVGGHQAVANYVAEDVALARCIKQSGLKLQHMLGGYLAELRMYRSWATLWEGWTKVLYSGSQRNLWLMILLAVLMLNIYSVPWLVLAIVFGKNILIGWKIIDFFTICLALSAIFFQYNLRKIVAKALHSSTKYWWLNSLAGLLVAVIAIASVVKTETGWGWTWRGRSLKLHK
ncbi:glycosyltransferase [Plectonema radiosum]|uniref:glycosyltransferase n=1 Tax=Plectonema radiosum TaxID=945768 RepID=UPI001D141D2F|nr:glycosyltransferase family 2 protein [Plectonema radiosum]